MRKLVTIATSLALVFGFAATAAAQKKGDKGQPKTKVYDFTGDTIEGDLIKPEGEAVNARDITQFSSLIRIRKHFIDEIIKAAEDL